MDQIVLMGDVVESRLIEDRQAFGKALRRKLQALSDEPFLQTRFAIVGVDQFTCVARPEKGLAGMLLELLAGLRPQRVRLVLAYGQVDFGEDAEDPAAMDGQAFHMGAQLLEEIEERGVGLGFGGFGDFDPSLRAVGTLLADTVNRWTDRQAEAHLMVLAAGDQITAAQRLAITPQSVHQHARATNYYHVEQVLRDLDETIRLATKSLTS